MFQSELQTYIKAGSPLFYVTTLDEVSAIAEILAVADSCKMKVNQWTATQTDKVPSDALLELARQPNSIGIMLNYHLYFTDNPVLIQAIKDAYWLCEQNQSVVIFLCNGFKLPEELKRDVVVLEHNLPTRETVEKIYGALIASAKETARESNIALNESDIASVDAALGLATQQIKNAFTLSLVKHKAILPGEVLDYKAGEIKKSEVLTFEPKIPDIREIGGLERLKSWLIARKWAYTPEARGMGLPLPKGILLVGPPGTGKSLSAKACAGILGFRTLRLDVGRLLGSLVGESESKTRLMIMQAEAMGQVVLWIDEIDKGLASTSGGSKGDSNVMGRMAASLLQWMNDKTSPVFIFATANDINSLDPALLRAGRLDAIFGVDLPTAKERQAIFQIHVQKYIKILQVEPDYNLLIQQTVGFSGAEIAKAVENAAYSSGWSGGSDTTKAILGSLQEIVPLSVSRREYVDEIRRWCDQYAIRASEEEREPLIQLGRRVSLT